MDGGGEKEETVFCDLEPNKTRVTHSKMKENGQLSSDAPHPADSGPLIETFALLYSHQGGWARGQGKGGSGGVSGRPPSVSTDGPHALPCSVLMYQMLRLALQ